MQPCAYCRTTPGFVKAWIGASPPPIAASSLSMRKSGPASKRYCSPDALAMDGALSPRPLQHHPYIQRDNPTAAREVAKNLYDGCESLMKFPHRGRKGNRPARANWYFLP